MKRILTFGISCIILLFTSCKKESTSANKCYLSISNIGNAYYYKITKITKGGSTIDISSVLNECQASARFELYKTGVVNYVEEKAGCNYGYSGTWSLDVTNKTVTFNINNSLPITIQDANVKGWDCTDLVLDVTYAGDSYTVTFTKQK